MSWLVCTNRVDDLFHRAIRSCIDQTLQNFELLVIANGPQHAQLLAAIASTYGHEPRVRSYGTPVHMLNFSLSLGVHLAVAPLIARMDADDVAHPERLEHQVFHMAQHPETAVVGSSYTLIDGNGNAHGHVNMPKDDAGIRRRLFYRNAICHPSAMIRKSVILELGGYLGGQFAEDYDLWVRIALNRNWHFANLPEYLLNYNIAPGGSARRSRRAYANAAAAQARNFLVSGDARWLIGSLINGAKSAVRANQE